MRHPSLLAERVSFVTRPRLVASIQPSLDSPPLSSDFSAIASRAFCRRNHVTPFYTRSPSVTLDSRDTPPSLHHSPATSELERASTAETTPIGTPRSFDPVCRRKSEREKEKDLLFSWRRRSHGLAGNPSSYVDSTLLGDDSEDSTFPLFGDLMNDEMTTHADPINIGSCSPWQTHSSNLTTALQSTSGNEVRPAQAMSINAANGKSAGFGIGHRDSLGGGLSGLDSRSGTGAQPISMNREKPRRESLAGSMVAGMSWGGVSVGSWIRDDIIMQGSSPFPYQSSSFHSSSYLPKLEANFMKDFQCCGLILPSTHELLQHYEENHAQQMPASLRKESTQLEVPPSNKRDPTNSEGVGQDQAQQTRPHDRISPNSTELQRSKSPRSSQITPRRMESATADYSAVQFSSGQDIDGLQDMEMDMDDDTMVTQQNTFEAQQYQMQDQPRMMQRSQFGQPAPNHVPPLNLNTLNMANPQQHQGLRTSTPTTPIGPGRTAQMYQNNPTVSSVNTPTLSAHPRYQQQYAPTPDSSVPGTPGEPGVESSAAFIPMRGQPFMPDSYQAGGNYYEFGNPSDMLNLCIDEPEKHLNYSSNKKYTKHSSSSQLGDGQYSENSPLARNIREQQRRAGVPDPQADGGVPKPFHCPVIGCEKAYKNQNGLKYHKSHGHNTQQLADNKDGTFSIVDPETLTPYPGTLGMEKHKPYRCDVCGKRYKNLNGLKYHKQHAPACDNEPRTNPGIMPVTSAIPGMSGLGGNLSQIGEGMAL